MEGLESLFERALRLDPPWKISKVEFKESEGAVKVFVDFPRGSVFLLSCLRQIGEGLRYNREGMEASQLLSICMLFGSAGAKNFLS